MVNEDYNTRRTYKLQSEIDAERKRKEEIAVKVQTVPHQKSFDFGEPEFFDKATTPSHALSTAAYSPVLSTATALVFDYSVFAQHKHCSCYQSRSYPYPEFVEGPYNA